MISLLSWLERRFRAWVVLNVQSSSPAQTISTLNLATYQFAPSTSLLILQGWLKRYVGTKNCNNSFNNDHNLLKHHTHMLNYIRKWKKVLHFHIGTDVVHQFLQTARDTINAHKQIVVQACLFTIRQLFLTYNNDLISSQWY